MEALFIYSEETNKHEADPGTMLIKKVFNRVFEGLEANAWSCKQVEQIISRLVRECRVYHGREMVFCLINLLLASPAFIHSGA